MRVLRHLACSTLGAAVLLAFTPVALGQNAAAEPSKADVDAIRREMRQLQQDYEGRIQALEQRLREMETRQQTTQTKAEEASQAIAKVNERIPPPSPTAVLGDSNVTESRQRGIRETENTLLRDRVDRILNDYIDIGGYFRAGYGLNDQGGVQVAFGAPGAQSKYRLGNEPENYGELVFGKNWYLPETFSQDRDPSLPAKGPVARVQIRPTFYNAYDSGSLDVGLGEAWASIGDVFESQPELSFWAGQRFYRRFDIHLIDFFFWNMTGAGGGVEGFKLGPGKLALAWLGASSGSAGYPEVGQLPPPQNGSGFSKHNLDLRYYDLPVPLGTLELGAIYSRAEGTTDLADLPIPGLDGFSVNAVHRAPRFLSATGENTLSVQYGYQSGDTFTTGFDLFSVINPYVLPDGQVVQPGTYILPALKNSWRFRVTESFITQPCTWFSIQPVAVYEYTDYQGVFGVQQWASLGARPILHLSKYFSLAFEGGIDWVTRTEQEDGWLYKLTFAPQVSLGRAYLSRPVVRFFVTYAGWSQGFQGEIGSSSYDRRTDGLTYGAQMEAWW